MPSEIYHDMLPLKKMLCNAILLLLAPFLTACGSHQIMLVGDSFWQRDQMRQAIYDGLKAGDAQFDFVGGEGRGLGPAGITSSVTDPDHEGVASKQLIHVLKGRTDDPSRLNKPIADLLIEYDPDVIAIQMGVNDIFWNFNSPPNHLQDSVGRTTQEMLSDVEMITRVVDGHNSSSHLIFTTVTPVGDGVKNAEAINERVQSYNAALAKKIEQLSNDGFKVALVDSYGAWNGVAEGHVSEDGLHPNQAGNKLLADAWLVELRRAISGL